MSPSFTCGSQLTVCYGRAMSATARPDDRGRPPLRDGRAHTWGSLEQAVMSLLMQMLDCMPAGAGPPWVCLLLRP